MNNERFNSAKGALNFSQGLLQQVKPPVPTQQPQQPQMPQQVPEPQQPPAPKDETPQIEEAVKKAIGPYMDEIKKMLEGHEVKVTMPGTLEPKEEPSVDAPKP